MSPGGTTEELQNLLAWIYLRQTIEASNTDILNLLWPEGWENRLADWDAGKGRLPMCGGSPAAFAT